MKFGILQFCTDVSIRPDDLARAVEERGFESYWAPEHTHIPTSRESPWPGGPDIPPEYCRVLDPFVALTAAACATRQLHLGTCVCLVVEREPIVTAKTIATLDHLSGGRFLFGVGGGWNLEELRNVGTDPTSRFRLLRERVEAMRAIWTDDVAEYHGQLVDFEPLWSWPKPARRPHPPVLIGGASAHTFQRVVDYGDGWIPRIAEFTPQLIDDIADLQRRVADAGRDPIDITVVGTPPSLSTVDELDAAGVHRIVLPNPSLDRDGALAALDRHADFLDQVGSPAA